MKLRILQVASYYPPAYSFGGPPQVMFSLGEELVRRGHSVAVYTTDVATIENWKTRIKEEYGDISGMKIHRFARVKYSDRLPTKFLKLLVNGIDKQCAQKMGGFDIIHISEVTNPLAVQYSSWASKRSIPYTISIFGNLSTSDSVLVRVLRRLFDRLWGRKMLKNAAALLVQTPHEAKICARYTSEGRVIPILLPVNISSFQNLPERGSFRKKYSIAEDKKIVLFLGRLHKCKGIQLLVEAFAELINKCGDDHRLVIAGADEGYRSFIVKRVRELGIEGKVIFTGPIFDRDKLGVYVDADVFVTTPTINEETSLAALEACACYTPVIVTERNAIPGLEEYEAGFHIHYDNQELVNALLKILTNETLREKLGENARKLIEEHYALDKVADKLESLFLKIIGDRASRSVTAEDQGGLQ